MFIKISCSSIDMLNKKLDDFIIIYRMQLKESPKYYKIHNQLISLHYKTIEFIWLVSKFLFQYI